MAELEISIPYRNFSKNQFVSFCVSWVLLGILSSVLMYIGIGVADALVHNGLYGPAKWLAFGLGGLIYVYVPFWFFSKYAQSHYLFANKDGIGIPGSMFGRSRWILWSELRNANYVPESACFELSYKPRGKIKLNALNMVPAEQQRLMMAIEVWAINAHCSANFLTYRNEIESKEVALGQNSYTQLWEDELQRRFNTPTFVPLEPGTRLRDKSIKILRQLAFGGFSAVYLAVDSDGQEMVLKESVIPAGISAQLQEKAAELFQREATLLTGLKHDRVARVLDHFMEHDRTYLVLEHIAGDTLREFIKLHGRQPEPVVKEWMTQLVEILQYLHSQKPPLVHRDFTPDNLILRPDDTIHLIDFGAANQFISDATGTLVGKQSYMPPEQVRGKATPISDLYALGGSAHFLLTGRDPVPLTVCRPRDLAPYVTEQMDALISTLTAQDPDTRIPDFSVLKGHRTSPSKERSQEEKTL